MTSRLLWHKVRTRPAVTEAEESTSYHTNRMLRSLFIFRATQLGISVFLRLRLVRTASLSTSSAVRSVSSEMFEEAVCKVGDLPEKSLKEFPVKNGKVLLAKENGKIYAVGTKCTHYGAPLVKGALHNGSLRCPWHGAGFSLSTGDIEDFPGIDSLPRYEVKIEGDVVKVKGKLAELTANCRKDRPCKLTNDKETVVIVGGGAAGFECCHTLRTRGFGGRIILVTEDNALPYDRTKLSKAMNSNVDTLQLRPAEYYKDADVETVIGMRVTKIDPTSKTVTYGDQTVNYTKLFLASGVKPRVFTAPGSDLQNIFYIRTHRDANKAAASATSKHVVILGTSFIGMEVAAYLAEKATSVTVIGLGALPFDTVFGARIGAKIKELHESKGVKFCMGRKIDSFQEKGGKLASTTLDNGEVLPSDIVIIGIGVQPDTGYLENSGIKTERGYVVVNSKLETNIPDVYAGGDMSFFPLSIAGGKPVAIGHWQMAMAHGEVAALNIMGASKDLHSVPFFWSMLFGKGIRYSGYTTDAKDIHIVGNVDDFKFIAYYFSNGKVVAVLTMGSDPVASLFALLTKSGTVLSKDDILKNSEEWIAKYGTKQITD